MEDHPQGTEQLSTLKRAIVELRTLRAKLNEAERARNAPIAVIGMGCRFPGGANDPKLLWQMLCAKADAVREVPLERWDIDEFFDPNPDTPGKMSTRWGGFLDDVDKFDADFFGVSPREAVTMDPQQRLLLEVAWEALENAGQSPEKLRGSSTGVFVGIASSDYSQLQMQFGNPDEIDAYFATGISHSVAPGRISHILGLQGPSIAIDTACSSSLVAVHLACQSLRLEECRMALAGGVNVVLAPELLINFSKAHMMAADGRCKSFDASADGFVRGEGCGVVVLKSLANALSDGDNILAVIRGTAVNQDGRSSGLTVPNGSAQQEVIRKALANAGVDASDVGYVETHGTGTSLGDPIEARAIHAVYGEGRSTLTALPLGSIKTNIGHLETAAGVAGLIKTILVLMHREIPPNLHFKSPNPHIPWDEFAISVPTALTGWPSRFNRRIAGVSSFGFSGTNAHVVVGEGPEGGEVATVSERSQQLLSISAKSGEALRELVGRYARYLGEHPEVRLSDICHTANTGRAHFEHRLAAVVSSGEQLRQSLAAVGAGEQPVEVQQGHADLTRRPEVVFLFTGQGGQYVNMGRELYESEPVFREVIERCEQLLRAHLERPLRQVLYPEEGQATGPEETLDETQYTHVAMFAVQYGLAQLWRSWGVEPGAVMGHSVGEIVAATVAGVMSLEDGLMLMRERGRLMQSLPATGTMASLLAGEEQVAGVLEPYRDRVAIAALNGPDSTVISGEREAVQEILGQLEAQGIKSKLLKVSNSFHSPLVEPVLEAFEEAAARAAYGAPQVAQFSSMRLDWVGEQSIPDAAYWRYNLRHTVRYHQAIAALYQQGYRVFLEIGPSPILVGMGSQCVPPGQSVWLPSLRQDRNDWEQMLDTLGTLYVNGVNIEWNNVDRQSTRRKVMLPTYPFQRRQFWVKAAATRRRVPGSPEITRWQNVVSATRAQSYQIPIDLNLAGYPARGKAFDKLTTTFMARTLVELGAFRKSNQAYSIDSLLQETGILPKYRILVGRWLRRLAVVGILQEAQGLYSSPKSVSQDLTGPLDPLSAGELSDVPFIVEYMNRCGRAASAILKGEASPLETLFPGGSLALAEQIYEHWNLSRYFNRIARSVFESLVRTLPRGRQLRIAEIGAGTGGVTSGILEVLPPERTQYYFTDASRFFFEHAREKYKRYPFLRFGLLDIEKNPAEQGFRQHSFDAVVAFNVLHATRSMDETIQNVLSLMAPGSVLVLAELTGEPSSWVEFCYGLIEGWNRFNDDVREDSPLLSLEQWVRLLRSHGFEDVITLPESGSPAEILGEHCIVARAPSSARSSLLVRNDTEMVEFGEEPSEAAAELDEFQKPVVRAHSFLLTLQQSPPDEQREKLVEFVRGHTMKVLRRDSSSPIHRRHRLMDLGVDSLMAVELSSRLSTELGLPRALPATLIFDYPSVEAVADHLMSQISELQRIQSEGDSGKRRQEPEESAAESVQGSSSIEDLSDEEVEKLLLNKLHAN